MAETRNENDLPHVTGKVKRINVKGHGPNSGHIQFVVSGVTLLITGPPKKIRPSERENDGYEPYLFTAMANLIIAAYNDNDEITVHYEDIKGTNFPREIDVPKLKKTKKKKAEVKRQKAESKRQKAESKKQKAVSSESRPVGTVSRKAERQ